MVEVIKNQPSEMLLTREQLKEIEHFQARISELERELTGSVDDFLSVLNRHYFNRENGYLDEQQANLREVVVLQSRLEKLAGKLAACTGELKSYMMGLQQSLHGKDIAGPGDSTAGPGATGETGRESAPVEAAPAETAAAVAAHDLPQAKEPAGEKKPAGQARPSAVVDRNTAELCPGTEGGGEVSLKLLFEELQLNQPQYSAIAAEISSAMRKMLYERKLVGYSKTSLVFGKDKNLGQLLEDLKPIFTSEPLRNLLVEKKLITVEEASSLHLVCNRNRELIFSVSV